MSEPIAVVGAVIVHHGLVLCAQRGDTGHLPGHWEFPGGKVETGETPQQALVREIDEELRCRVEVGEEVTTTVHAYDDAVVSLTTYSCRLVEGVPEPTEHAAVRWVAPEDLATLDWAPADVPAVEIVQQLSGGTAPP